MRRRTSLLAVLAGLAVPLGAHPASAQSASAGAAPPGAADAPPVSTLPLKHAPRPTQPEITAADLMTRLYIFADDSMQGREAGTEGNVRGTRYIASELKRVGLQPAGEDGTYFQTIPLRLVAFDGASSMRAGGRQLKAMADYVPLARASVRLNGAEAVYAGSLADSSGWIAPGRAAGRVAVFYAPPDLGARRLTRLIPDVPDAAAVVLVTADDYVTRYGRYYGRPRTVMDDGSDDGPPELLVAESAAGAFFDAPVASLVPGTKGHSVDADIRFTREPIEYPARNVVAIVPGSDPALRGEYVAVGAHNDHIGMTRTPVAHDSLRIWNHVVRPEGADDGGNQASAEQQARVNRLLAAYRAKHPGPVRLDSIDNGADDDGSGTVAALEIAEKFATMRQKPRRSLLFVFHVGEEKGLLGSRWFTDHPTVPRDSIVAQLNMDMVGRGAATDETGRTRNGAPLHGGAGYLQLVGSRRLSTELGDLVESVNREDGHGITFDYAMDADGHPSNIYCRSDHYEYARFGIPITFFTTGLHSDYHQVTDEPEYIDYDHMARVASLVEDVALHVANLDHRLRLDGPAPDPSQPCRQ